jgi:hypothetical protein
MRLPDFFKSEELNNLKERMGLPRDAVGALNVSIGGPRLSALELEKLVSPDGLDIKLDELVVLKDGTLSYKNSRVLLYIRDVMVFGGREAEPRFHLAKCSTLIKMKENNRFARYVVSTNSNGKFKLNFIKGGVSHDKLQELAVCQNCLGLLRFDGFEMTWGRSDRLSAVKAFNLEEVFTIYPRSLHSDIPKYNADSGPLNEYPMGFGEISNRVRSAARWTCQKCKIDLSGVSNRKYLHTHHRNGAKYDSDWSNLEAVCLGCHAEMASHHHMKSTSSYTEFLSVREQLRRRR